MANENILRFPNNYKLSKYCSLHSKKKVVINNIECYIMMIPPFYRVSYNEKIESIINNNNNVEYKLNNIFNFREGGKDNIRNIYLRIGINVLLKFKGSNNIYQLSNCGSSDNTIFKRIDNLDIYHPIGGHSDIIISKLDIIDNILYNKKYKYIFASEVIRELDEEIKFKINKKYKGFGSILYSKDELSNNTWKYNINRNIITIFTTPRVCNIDYTIDKFCELLYVDRSESIYVTLVKIS